MKVLVLSCNTGGGHNACAKALQEACALDEVSCDIVDTLGLISPKLSSFVSWGHVFIYRWLPWAFSVGYGLSEKYAAKPKGEKALLYRLFYLGSDKLSACIRSGGYDLVICTHPFAATMLTETQRRYCHPVRTVFVATDYTCSPTVKDSKLDYYVIPHRGLKEEFLCPNIPEEKILLCGLPIRQAFYEKLPKHEARQRLGLPQKCRHIVMMCGSMGCGPIPKLSKALSSRMTDNTRLTVVCGTNQRLCKRLTRRFSGDSRIRILGYVQDVGLLLSSADLYITKPGGISVTETAAKNVPMVLMDAVAGCERYNGQFYVQRGCAVMHKKVDKLSASCQTLLTDQVRYNRMVQSLQPMQKENTAKRMLALLSSEEKTGC